MLKWQEKPLSRPIICLCTDDSFEAQTRYAVISQLIHPTSASQNSDFVVCRAFLAADLPSISERFLLDQWQSKISGQPVLHTILVLRLRDSLLRLPGALVLDRVPSPDLFVTE